MRRVRVKFNVDQATPSFSEGAPQREEYFSDEVHEAACERYSTEWREHYDCPGCAGDSNPKNHRFSCPELDRP